jgi:hypothetical protein
MRTKSVKRSARNFYQRAAIALSAATVLSVAPLAQAELVTNGGFEVTSAGTGQINFNTTVTGWSLPVPNDSYAFIYAPGTADTTGAASEYGNVQLWGPNNGSPNGLPASSPAGGNFLASDGAFQNNGPLTQTINGLVAGDEYSVSFWWAAAQQQGFNGDTTSGWIVDFGGAPVQSVDTSLTAHDFSGWMQQTFYFTADGPSDVLSFMSQGTPSSTEPPFALLDGVSVNPSPEPGTWALLLTGILGAAGVSRARRWMKR